MISPPFLNSSIGVCGLPSGIRKKEREGETGCDHGTRLVDWTIGN